MEQVFKNLQLINQQMDLARKKCGTKAYFRLRPMINSFNLVTKLYPPIFIPKKVLENFRSHEESKITSTELLNNLINRNQHFPMSRHGLIGNFIYQFSIKTLDVFHSRLTDRQKIDRVVEMFDEVVATITRIRFYNGVHFSDAMINNIIYLRDAITDMDREINMPDGENISLYEFLAMNDNRFESSIIEKIIAPYINDKPSYSFKVSIDNNREMLAARLASYLKLEQYLWPKIEIDLPAAKIGFLEAPTGLASEWIDDQEEDLSRVFYKYYVFKGVTANAAYVNVPAEHLQLLYTIFKKYEDKIDKLASAESLEGCVLLDLILCNADSHRSQYKVDQDTVLNIDFSRFAFPCEVYTHKEATYALISSFFLDYLIEKKTVSKSTITHINSWNVDSFEKSCSEYVLDESFFDERLVELKALREDLGILYSIDLKNEADIVSIAKNYGLEKDNSEDISHFHAELLTKLLARLEDGMKECFKYIHPQALRIIVARLNALKNYISSTKEPDWFGIFSACYPHFAPFIPYLMRADGCAGVSISYYAFEKFLDEKSLETIIMGAKETCLASPSEIEAMEDSLKYLKTICLKKRDLLTGLQV